MGGRIQWKREDHPVEVIARMRQSNQINATAISLAGKKTVRVNNRNFTLDGLSWSGETLESFYDKYIKFRVEGVKNGGKCTVILYGATGSGKSYTMFGPVREEPGIVYRALHHILDDADGDDEFVNVEVWEIFNEEVNDLLRASLAKGVASQARVRLEVRGRKVINGCSISGKKAEDIVAKIQLVEKKRIVKSTNCNERSSRSHCIIKMDVPAVGGQLVLVDMAGSENIDQAAIAIDEKMQTGKINQGNGALKRVVEAIANGDNHIPYRDSKLTMILQDSFEDDKAKILMILCASTDQKDIHKTISTLEYGAKAKCIVKLPKSLIKEKVIATDQIYLENRIKTMHSSIEKLQAENRLKDECREEIEKVLNIRNQQVENLKSRVMHIEREKYHFMAGMLKINEKLLELIHKIENKRKIITETEIRKYTEIEEHQAKIRDLVDIVQSMEDELIHKISDYQYHKGLTKESSMVQNSCCSIVNCCAISNCLTKDAYGSAFLLTSKSVASHELQVQLESTVLGDPNIACNKGSQVLSCNVSKKMNDVSSCCGDNSCYVTRHGEDQQASEKIRQKEEGTKIHSLRDWDEEVQFTVVCNDSEHKAVVCQSCDQIDELSSLSYIDSEVPMPSVQVCSSADLHILKESSTNVDKNDEMKHPTLPSKVFRSDEDDSKADIHICGEASTLPEEKPNKSSMFSNVSVNSSWVPVPGVNRIIDMDWMGGISFKGWLPAIPETSFEGEEDSENYNEESKVDNDKSHRGIVVLKMENMANNSKGEASYSNAVVNDFGTGGISFKGWLPAIPETSFEGEEDSETYNEQSTVDSDKSDRGIVVLKMENMANNSKGEASNSNVVNDFGPGNTVLDYEGCNPSHSDCSYIRKEDEGDDDCKSRLQMEINHNNRENVSQDIIQVSGQNDCGNMVHTETQNPCCKLGSSLIPTFCLTCIEKEQGEVEASIQNLDGVNEENTYARPIQSAQKAQLWNDEALCCFELGINFVTKHQPRYNHEEIEVVEPADSPTSWPEETEIVELEDSPTSLYEEIGVVEPADSPTSWPEETEIVELADSPTSWPEETEIVELADSPTLLSASSEKTVSPLSQLRESHSSSGDDACNVDVYVKWGKSTEDLGKHICILSTPKAATLSELRKEITPHIAHANKQFTFLMLGDSGGGEVDQEIESELRVGSLLDCSAHKGCRLACLRPPRRMKLSLPSDRVSIPLSQIENQIPHPVQTVDIKKHSKSSNARTSPSLKKGGLRTILNKKDRSKMTFKDKAKALYFQDLTCTLLHGV